MLPFPYFDFQSPSVSVMEPFSVPRMPSACFADSKLFFFHSVKRAFGALLSLKYHGSCSF